MEQELRQRLEADRARLLNELGQLSKLSPVRGEPQATDSMYGTQRDDDAMQTMEWEKRLALDKNLRERLAEVEHAIAKFETTKYGLCESCGHHIDLERLKALPQARLCMNCKARQGKEWRVR